MISTGCQGEPMSALTLHGRQREPVAQASTSDDTVILVVAPDPGQRDERHQGDRRARAPRRRGGALRARGRARHRPRQAGGAQDAPLDRRARSGSCRCTASTATSSPTPSWPETMGVADDQVLAVRGRRPDRPSTDDGVRDTPDGCRPATSSSTASSATSATACCATAGCSPRRASWWSSSPSTLETGAILTGPEVITRGWVYAPEAEELLDECAERGRQARQGRVRQEHARRHRQPAAGGAPAAGRFVSDRTKRRPMIVPVVMET